MRQIEQREDRFKELILYVSSKCASSPTFGATVLNKILFFADFIAYQRFGDPITGMEYQALPQGPAPRRMKPIQREMEKAGDLVIQPRQLLNGKVQHRAINLRSARLSIFTGDQIALVDQVIDALCHSTANQVSELSHQEFGWKAARLHETIPYPAALIHSQRPTLLDAERAKNVEAKHAELLEQFI